MENILQVKFLLALLCFGLVGGQTYDVLKYGAKGDGITDDSKAFVGAWNDMCGSNGTSKTLLIPSNYTFLLQPLVFQGPCKSPNIQVQLKGNIVAPHNTAAWSTYKSAWIDFQRIFGLTINGSGTVDGRGLSFWKANLKAKNRPTQLHFSGCNNLKIIGITSINSPKNHISINKSKQVEISQTKLFAPGDSPNTDGIDISNSTNVKVSDTIVATGDDCVAINTGSVNISVTRMICGPGHGISVGSLGKDGEESIVENVLVSNCTFNGTDNGVRIKTWPNGKGYAKNIHFENITLIDAKNPIIIDQNYIDKGRFDVEESAVAISNVTYINIHGTSKREEIIKLDCSKVTTCKNIVLNKIDIATVDGNKPVVECQNVQGNSTGYSDADKDVALCFGK